MTKAVTARRTTRLPEGEGAIIVAFVAIPMIWAGLAVSMADCWPCPRRLAAALGAAALLGLAAAALREIVLARAGVHRGEER